MRLANKGYKKERKRPLKRSKVGFELESFLIDEKGKISAKAPEVIIGVEKKGETLPIEKEVGKSMIEFGCYPDVISYYPALDLINSLSAAIEVAHEDGLLLYPFGTYPGKFVPARSQGRTYKIKEGIFGKERFKIAMKCAGFHHHYTLPKGVFDAKSKKLRVMMNSKLKRSMMASYNFEIAIDPIVTLFTQSSPFFDGVQMAKDSRMVAYRGGKKLKNPDGLYAHYQQIGGLPPYKQTATDLLQSLYRRQMRWERAIKKADPKADFDKLYPIKLDIGWNPVKMNKHGTLEQRGMDANYVSTLFGVSVLLKFCLQKIQREFVEVIPADFGISEAFKLESGILFIPPQTYVRNNFQMWSAYNGYGKKEMHAYAKRFYNFAKSVTPKRYNKIIRPIGDMLENKESLSDKMISYARRKGFMSNGKMTDSDAAEFALHYSELFYKDLGQIKDSLNRMETL